MRFLLCLGDVLVSLCDEGQLKAWDLKRKRGTRLGGLSNDHDTDYEDESSDEESAACETALEGGFVPTALAHPPTYLNKVVIGSEGGALQLWNVRTGRSEPDNYSSKDRWRCWKITLQYIVGATLCSVAVAIVRLTTST